MKTASSRTCAHVDQLFTCCEEKDPCCPFTKQKLVHGSSDSTFEYCHWIPKHLEGKLPSGLRLGDNAANFFPTTKLVERNIELYQRAPNMSLKYKCSYNKTYDTYEIMFNPNLQLNHMLRQSTGAIGENKIVAIIPSISRPFVELHYRVFCMHHGLSYKPYTDFCDLQSFEKLQTDTLFGLIMLNSPFSKSAKEALRKQTSTPEKKQNSSVYPALGLAPGQAKLLVGKIVRLSSEMFPNWPVSPYFMDTYIAGHSSSKRTFEFVFPEECNASEFERFKKEYKRDPSGFDINVYYGQTEASLVKFGESHFVNSLHKDFLQDKKSSKRLTTSKCAPKRTLSKRGCSSQESFPSMKMVEPALISSAQIGARVRVFWTTQWLDGSIQSIDGDCVKVIYDENNGVEEHVEFSKLKYRLVAKPFEEQAEGDVVAKPPWKCIQCQILHEQIVAPPYRICCSKCKQSAQEIGVNKK